MAALGLLLSASPCTAQEVLIGAMQDLSLGSWSGSGDLQAVGSLCVRSDQDGAYSVQAYGDGSGGAFELPGAVSSLAYSVDYDAGTGWLSLTAGTPATGLSGARNNGQYNRCRNNGEGDGAEQLRVTIRATAFEQAIAGSYSGNLTLVVAPE